MVANAPFFQIEFGMSAGRPRFSCRLTQNTNAGIRPTLTMRRATFEAVLMLSTLSLRVLHLSALCLYTINPRTYVSTYDNNANEVLAMLAPIQSTSFASLTRTEVWPFE